jgi:Protein of unknown function (DUF3617)
MRAFILLPIAALTACGGSESQNQAKATANAIQPGQYEVTTEVTGFRKADAGTPKIDTPVGTRATRSVCVSGTAVMPDLFADQGFACQTTGTPYVRGGTLNLTLTCTRPGLQGSVGYSITGRFDGESFQGTRGLQTSLSTDGDVAIQSTISGRRTGACQAGGTAPAAPTKH